jgi:hypothetical protein
VIEGCQEGRKRMKGGSKKQRILRRECKEVRK